MGNKKELNKVCMNLSDKSLNNVQELGTIIGESNRTRVVASALEISKEIMKQVKNGKHVIIRSDDGKEQEMNFIIG